MHTEYRFDWNSKTKDFFFYKATHKTLLMGNGVIRSEKRVGIADTAWVEGEWRLDKESGQIVEVEKDYYELYNPWCNSREDNPYTLRKDIYLYEVGRVKIPKENSRILRFIKTDGKETMVYAEVLTSGEIKRGWIHKEDIANIENLWLVD